MPFVWSALRPGSFIIFLMFIVGFVNAQPLKPIVLYKAGPALKGYYFVTPYMIKKPKDPPKSMQLVLDATGEVIHYSYKIRGAELQPNGLLAYCSGPKFYLLNKELKAVDSVVCVGDVQVDMHDFRILANGHFLVMGTETVIEDYSKKYLFLNKKAPGSKRAKVKYGVIQELDKNKKLVFEWRSKGVYVPEDADPFYLKDTLNIDLTHFNAVDMDEKGNLLVSMKHYNEVVKISRTTGNIIWRMGGKKNNIKVLNDTLPFYCQHDVRVSSPGRFTLFDNGFTGSATRHPCRALEYEVNDATKTARVIWTYTNENKPISEANGNVQILKNGNMLVNYGKIENGNPNLTFEIVDSSRNKLFQLYFPDTMGTYRALYYEQLPFNLIVPSIKVEKKEHTSTLSTTTKYKFYLWSNGSNQPQIQVTNSGVYYVFVSNDGESFTRSEVKMVSVKGKEMLPKKN